LEMRFSTMLPPQRNCARLSALPAPPARDHGLIYTLMDSFVNRAEGTRTIQGARNAPCRNTRTAEAIQLSCSRVVLAPLPENRKSIELVTRCMNCCADRGASSSDILPFRDRVSK